MKKNRRKINTGQKTDRENSTVQKEKQILYLVAHTQIYHCELFPLFFVFITIIFIVPFFIFVCVRASEFCSLIVRFS